MQAQHRKPIDTPKEHQMEAAWQKLIRAFPYADAVTSESTIFEFRSSVGISSELAIFAIEWAKHQDELRNADMKGGMFLTESGSDRWRG